MMRRPKEIRSIIPTLAFHSIGLNGLGLLFLFWGSTSSTPIRSELVLGGGCLLLLGLPLALVSVQFYRLRPWTYPIVKFLVTSPVGLRGAMLSEKPFNSREMLHAFHRLPEADQELTDNDQKT